MKQLLIFFCLVIACGIDDLYDFVYNWINWSDMLTLGLILLFVLIVATVSKSQTREQ